MSQLITTSTASFTRPSNTTQYAINDVLGTSPATVMTFANCARLEGGSGIIIGATHSKNNATVTSALFRLFLWNVAPTAIVDNDPHTLLYANRTSRVAIIDFSTHITSGSGSDSSVAITTERSIPYKCAAGGTSLFGVAVPLATYTPVSAEQHWFELQLIQG
jgi:hypothetical protein